MSDKTLGTILEDVIGELNIPVKDLAAAMMTTPRKLTDSYAPLSRVADMIFYMKYDVQIQDPAFIWEILNNARVPVGTLDPETDGSVSLISYACAAPEDIGWRANVGYGILEYQNYLAYIQEQMKTDKSNVLDFNGFKN